MERYMVEGGLVNHRALITYLTIDSTTFLNPWEEPKLQRQTKTTSFVG